MMDKKTFSIGFVVAFIVLTIYLYKQNDQLATVISNDGSAGIFWYFISNPAYVLLLASILYFNSGTQSWRNVIGSIMLILASDIVSYPRFLTSGLGQENALLASSDGLFFKKLLSQGFSYHTAFLTYYLIVPIALVIGALAVLGIHNFFKQITKGGSN